MVSDDKWIVAVSGGPDSMALLHKLISNNISCVVCHVNYHMRDVSDQEEALVRDFCIANGVDFRVRSFVDSGVGNFQARARNFRYEFFKEVALEVDALGVVVGHHLDDDIETYIFQKERNMMSIAVGLAKYSVFRGLRVWRPLLAFSKEELVQYCIDEKIDFALDLSNFELDYTRNAIRHRVVDRESIVREIMIKKVEHQALNERIRFELNHLGDEVLIDSYAMIDRSIRIYVLREWLICMGVDVYQMALRFFTELDRQILLGNAYHEFSDVQFYCGQGKFLVDNPQEFRVELSNLECGVSNVCSFSDVGMSIQGITFLADDFPIVVRSWRVGDKLNLSFGSKMVSRYFIDNKITRNNRKKWPVIENARGELIFVVGMGCDVHHISNNPETFVIELNLS